MLPKLLLAFGLMSLSVVIHATGVTWAMRRLRHDLSERLAFWRIAWICVRVAFWMVVCHLIEVAAFAFAYVSSGAMPDLQSAFYFSGVTYTTTGYGDLLLPSDWRLVGAVEALTGILMCGWSTAFFFAILSRIPGLNPLGPEH